MDSQRMAVLRTKAAAGGLSWPEACELGRLYAEEAGKPYSNAEDVRRANREAEKAALAWRAAQGRGGSRSPTTTRDGRRNGSGGSRLIGREAA